MRLSHLVAALTLLSSMSTFTFAQEPMNMDNNMGMSMKSQPMPKNVKETRQIVPLTDPEKAIVMAQMRQMLTSAQGIADGLARGDLQTVVDAASKSGMAMMQGVPSQIRMKFPPAFAQMGMASHQTFDRIARDTKSIKDPTPVLKQLSSAMQNCIACHATYRFAPPKH